MVQTQRSKWNCVIFGGTGFIGTHLARELLNKGLNVAIFARSKNPDKEIEGAEYIYGDFMNAHDINKAVKGYDYVFHLISLTNPAISDKDPYIDIDTNIRMSVKLLESCVENNVKRIIYVSSGGAIYGNREKDMLSEMDPTEPVSPYGIGKATIEGYLRYFKAKYKLDYIVLRASNVYGEGQDITRGNHGVVSIFIDKIMHDQAVMIMGGGGMVRDYIYVKDLTRFIGNSFNLQHEYDTYNIGSGKGITVNEVLQTVKDVLQKDVVVTHSVVPSSFVKHIVLDTTRVTSEFGEIATTQLSEGIKSMISNYVQ